MPGAVARAWAAALHATLGCQTPMTADEGSAPTTECTVSCGPACGTCPVTGRGAACDTLPAAMLGMGLELELQALRFAKRVVRTELSCHPQHYVWNDSCRVGSHRPHVRYCVTQGWFEVYPSRSVVP